MYTHEVCRRDVHMMKPVLFSITTCMHTKEGNPISSLLTYILYGFKTIALEINLHGESEGDFFFLPKVLGTFSSRSFSMRFELTGSAAVSDLT